MTTLVAGPTADDAPLALTVRIVIVDRLPPGLVKAFVELALVGEPMAVADREVDDETVLDELLHRGQTVAIEVLMDTLVAVAMGMPLRTLDPDVPPPTPT